MRLRRLPLREAAAGCNAPNGSEARYLAAASAATRSSEHFLCVIIIRDEIEAILTLLATDACPSESMRFTHAMNRFKSALRRIS